MPNTKKKFKSQANVSVASFSKNLLGLKFMKNAKNEAEKVKEEKEGSFGAQLGNKLSSKQQYIINPSYQFCERLRFGRFSFKGMNAYIESLMYNKKLEAGDIAAQKRGPPSSSESDNEIDNLDSDRGSEEEGNDDDEDEEDKILGDLK